MVSLPAIFDHLMTTFVNTLQLCELILSNICQFLCNFLDGK